MKITVRYLDPGFIQVYDFASKKVIVPYHRSLTEFEVYEQLLAHGIECSGTLYYEITFILEEELFSFILLDATKF